MTQNEARCNPAEARNNFEEFLNTVDEGVVDEKDLEYELSPPEESTEKIKRLEKILSELEQVSEEIAKESEHYGYQGLRTLIGTSQSLVNMSLKLNKDLDELEEKKCDHVWHETEEMRKICYTCNCMMFAPKEVVMDTRLEEGRLFFDKLSDMLNSRTWENYKNGTETINQDLIEKRARETMEYENTFLEYESCMHGILRMFSEDIRKRHEVIYSTCNHNFVEDGFLEHGCSPDRYCSICGMYEE